MNRFAMTTASLVLLGVLAGSPAAAAEGRPGTSAGAPDSGAIAPPSPAAELRAAYQNAWAERQAGDFEAAVRTADAGLEQAAAALAAAPDAAARTEIADLQSRLAGLKAAAAHDRDDAATAARSGNEADANVLSAPAADAIQPQMNDAVLKWIDFFTGNGRSTFERWLKRSGRYMELFRQALQKEGLPPDLVHVVFVESGFNVNARSVSAAVGPWQFLKGTARLFGLTINQWIDERRDPEKSTIAAARYLKHLYTIFGDWPLALASYNAGEGTVLRAIKAQGTTNYWDLNLPRQTEEYVPQFMAILTISRDPRKYGFDGVSLDEPMAFDEVALKGAVDLRALARLADCSYDELKLLNPAVLHAAANGANGVTMLRVPRGKGEALMQKLNGGAKLPAVDLTLRHRVGRGETLNKIAAQYHVSPSRLALANGIGRKRPLRRGTTLVIPASLGAPAPAQINDDDPRASTAYVPPRVGLVSRSMVQGRSEPDGRTVHKVTRGETLAGIAAHYEVSVAELKKWNRLKRERVVPGMRLKVRPGSEPRAGTTDDSPDAPLANLANPKPADAKSADAQLAKATATVTPVADDVRPAKRKPTHRSAAKSHATVTVRRGATLSSIAKQHGVTVNELKRANKLKSSQVRAGQRLKLPA